MKRYFFYASLESWMDLLPYKCLYKNVQFQLVFLYDKCVDYAVSEMD